MGKLAKLIGNRIREVRTRKGLRQEDMENFGLNYRYYQDIETGKANLTLATIEKIARAFEIEPEDFFTMPLSSSQEGTQLAAQIETIIREDDKDAIRKILVLINEVVL